MSKYRKCKKCEQWYTQYCNCSYTASQSKRKAPYRDLTSDLSMPVGMKLLRGYALMKHSEN